MNDPHEIPDYAIQKKKSANLESRVPAGVLSKQVEDAEVEKQGNC
jgi:hypothetical protein